MIDVKVSGSGFVSAGDMQKFIIKLVDVLNDSFQDVEARMEAQDAKIKRLQSELDAERRLRLGARK